MAERRMFSKSIVTSDAFLDLPATAQMLYFQLGMRADDDGFINSPKSILRMTGASSADLDSLIESKFVLAFPSGVIAIKHWRINNTIRKDSYSETNYKEEKRTLSLDSNMAYTQKKISVINSEKLSENLSSEDKKNYEIEDLEQPCDNSVTTNNKPCNKLSENLLQEKGKAVTDFNFLSEPPLQEKKNPETQVSIGQDSIGQSQKESQRERKSENSGNVLNQKPVAGSIMTDRPLTFDLFSQSDLDQLLAAYYQADVGRVCTKIEELSKTQKISEPVKMAFSWLTRCEARKAPEKPIDVNLPPKACWRCGAPVDVLGNCSSKDCGCGFSQNSDGEWIKTSFEQRQAELANLDRMLKKAGLT